MSTSGGREVSTVPSHSADLSVSPPERKQRQKRELFGYVALGPVRQSTDEAATEKRLLINKLSEHGRRQVRSENAPKYVTKT